MNNSNEINPNYYSKIQKFTLMDDIFMSKVFEDKKCVEKLLSIILKKEFKVIKAVSQCSVNNLQGRSVRLDIFAVDDNNIHYNIEVQRSNSGATPMRARYNGSLIDANITDPGDDLKNLPECYVIFITENDVLKGDLPLYTIERTIKEMNNRSFGDGSHIIYVNGAKQDDTALGLLMKDFSCQEAENMYYKELAERVSYFKTDNGGVSEMCQIMEELRQETLLEAKIEFALNLIVMGDYSLEKIAQATGLPLEKVKELAASKPA